MPNRLTVEQRRALRPLVDELRHWDRSRALLMRVDNARAPMTLPSIAWLDLLYAFDAEVPAS